MTNLQMAEKLRCALPPVVATINVCDGNLCQFFVEDIIEAHDVDSVHLADRRFVSNPEASYTTVLAEVVVVLLGVEQILRQFCFSR